MILANCEVDKGVKDCVGYICIMPRSLHFRRSASYNMAQDKPVSKPNTEDGGGKVKRKKAKLLKESGSRSSVSSSSTMEEDHEAVCIVTVTASSSRAQTESQVSRKRPKKKKSGVLSKKGGGTPQLVKLPESVVRSPQGVRSGRSKSQGVQIIRANSSQSVHRVMSPQRQRQRSRSRSKNRKSNT